MNIVPWAKVVGSGKEDVLPVAVISLADQQERRQLLINRGLPSGWLDPSWPATDLRFAETEHLASLIDSEVYREVTGELIKGGIVGCAASHHRLATWFSKTNLPLLLVLEDDVIPCASNFPDMISLIASQFLGKAKQGDAFIIHLGARPEQLANSILRPVKPAKDCGDNYKLWRHVDPRRTIWRAHAYLLSRGAALRASRRELLMRTVADDWILRRDLGLLRMIYTVDPRIFMQDTFIESTINHQLIDRKDKFKIQSLRQRLFSSTSFRAQMLLAKILSRLPERLA